MEKLARVLHGKKDAKILDVGTGSGNFISLITSCYQNYSEIIGIDNYEVSLKHAKESFDDKRIHFELMDALDMDFEDNTFDFVCLSNSLHHLLDVKKILTEIKRVLKTDGTIIIAEMLREPLTKKQVSHLKLHHFAAKIDRLRGEVHNETFNEKEIVKILRKKSEFTIAKRWKLRILRGNKEIPDRFKWYEKTIERLLSRVPEDADIDGLKEEGKEVMEYIKNNGFDSCPTLIVVMEK